MPPDASLRYSTLLRGQPGVDEVSRLWNFPQFPVKLLPPGVKLRQRRLEELVQRFVCRQQVDRTFQIGAVQKPRNPVSE